MLNNPFARRAVPVVVRWVASYFLDQDDESTDGEIFEDTDIAEDDSEEKTISILIAERTAVIVAENSDQA